MSTFECPPGSSQYTGQRANDRATQIIGNVGNFYANPPKQSVEDCLAALWLTDALEDRKSLIDKKGCRVSGTCEWIKKNKAYLSWLRSPPQLLWLSGGPGKGKTMLSIFLAEELEQIARESTDKTFIQYFCDDTDEKRNTAVAILKGLISQLLKEREKLVVHLPPIFKIQQGTQFNDSSFGTLWTCFESMVCDPSLGIVDCVIDGLDECDESSLEVLLKRLRALFSPNADLPSSCHLNLIAVSREQPDFVARELSDFPRIRLGPHTDSGLEDDLNSDISNFITAKVGELSRYGEYPPQLRSYVEHVFRERSEGTFLWIGIVARELEKCTCDEVKDALDNFPPGLQKLYHRMLLQLPSRRRENTAKILRWIVMAVRPLTIPELGTAIGITVEPSLGLDFEKVTLERIMNCGHLLTITNTSAGKKVGLVHQSVKDYLLRQTCDPISELEFFHIKKEEANLEIATRCLDSLQDGLPIDEAVREDHSCWKAFPLLRYAVFHWNEHARCLSDPELDIFDLSRPFYADNSPVRKAWLNIYAETKLEKLLASYPLLFVISYFGIFALVEKLLRNSWLKKYLRLGMNKKASKALCLAVRQPNEAVVRLLIENGADLRARDETGWPVLHLAAQYGNEAVVRLLIKEGADIKAKDETGGSVLHSAAFCGNEAIMRLLIKEGADIKAKNKAGLSVLHSAVFRGNETIMRLLIEKGADIKVKNKRGLSVLHSAAFRGNETVVRLLIEKGADLKAKDKRGGSVLHSAVFYRNEAVVRLLIEKGADMEAKDTIGWSALHSAVFHGNEAVVRLLIEKGADIKVKDKIGLSVLHSAVLYRNKTVIQLLIEKEADIETKDTIE